MVHNVISDNVVQIGLSIEDITTLSYDIVLKNHISKIQDFTVQFDALPLPAQTVTFTDITNTPNVELASFAGVGATPDTLDPDATPTPNTCGRVIRIATTPALNNGNNILYVKIMFEGE